MANGLSDANENWEVNDEDAGQIQYQMNGIEAVSWTASEFIHHQKAANWFAILAGVAVAAGIAIFFLAGIFSAFVTVFGIVCFGIVGARPPRTLHYNMSEDGIVVENRRYAFDDFKYFSIMSEGGIDSIVLIPLKRFMPILTLYFAPQDGERIVNLLATFLPHVDRSVDLVDRLMRRIHF